MVLFIDPCVRIDAGILPVQGLLPAQWNPLWLIRKRGLLGNFTRQAKTLRANYRNR